MNPNTPIHTTFQHHLDRYLNDIRQTYTNTEIIAVTLGVNQQLLQAQAEVARMRREAVRHLRLEGWTLKAIGEEVGISVQRVAQIEQGDDRHTKG